MLLRGKHESIYSHPAVAHDPDQRSQGMGHGEDGENPCRANNGDMLGRWVMGKPNYNMGLSVKR